MIAQYTVTIANYDTEKAKYVLNAEAVVDGTYRRVMSVFQHLFTDPDAGQSVTFVVGYVP